MVADWLGILPERLPEFAFLAGNDVTKRSIAKKLAPAVGGKQGRVYLLLYFLILSTFC